jgi:dihydrodipicolinate synthase/N-acetylneuraminate lyase
MTRLGASDIYGIWAGSIMCWDENDRFDAEAYAANIRRTLQHRPHGVYTTGSTGEFYAIDLDEFKLMVDIQAQLCGEANVPLQIGCCSDATHKTLRLLEYAASKKQVGAVQIVLPYWMELTDREVLKFFGDLYRACPDMPIVHYNIPRSTRFLHAKDYLRILEVCPSLVGVKYTFAGSHFGDLQSDISATPQLSYFVAEPLLASAMQLGARGCYSSLIGTNPQYMMKFYDAAAARRWDEAMKMQKSLAAFFSQLGVLIDQLGESTCDPTVDKAMAVAAGFAQSHQRCRAPYIGWSDQSVSELRGWMRESYPDLIYDQEQASGSTGSNNI